MGSAISGFVDLACIRVAEQVWGDKPVSSASPWSLLQFLLPGSGLEFLAWLASMMSRNLETE